MADNGDVQAKLADIDDQLETLRGETTGLTEQTGDSATEGPQEPEDEAAALTNSQENGALIEMLAQRRQALLDGIAPAE